MIRLPFLPACIAALTFAASPGTRAATTAPGARPATSPDQPVPRSGDYRVIEIGAKVIRARCAEGGNVFVATHPPSSATGGKPGDASRTKGVSAERAAALRAACQSVDYTK